MDAFLEGTDVTLSIPLTDLSGNALDVQTVEYQVYDNAGVELIPRTALEEFAPGAETAEVPVPAAMNVIPVGETRALRIVKLFCTVGDAANTVLLVGNYAIENGDPLQIGVNSFQTYAQADFVALDIPNLPGWSAAGVRERVAALIEARLHIVQLNFTQLNSNVVWGQDSLNFVPEGTITTPYASRGLFLFNGSLELLTPEQFKKLPDRFVQALCRAQVAEADTILNGADAIEKKRIDGMTSDAVGESKQSFRASTPLRLPVSRRALGYLSYFVGFTKRIGRG